MLKLFLPDEHVKSIFDIDVNNLQKIGIKGIVIDLDNTLVPWNVRSAPDDVVTWLNELNKSNINVIVFSNNNRERVSFFCQPINKPYIARAKKPLGRSFRKARKQMGLKKSEMAVIGDQLLTDVFGGNRAGLYTILVQPLVKTDAPITKFNRNIERLILNHFYRTGKLTRRN